jgi:hypothetical protein
MGMHEREWARPHRAHVAQHNDAWRAIRGLAVVAVAVLGVLVFGKALLNRSGVIAPYSHAKPELRGRYSLLEPLRLLTPTER